MTTTVKITTHGHPVRLTRTHKHATGDRRATEEKIPAGKEVDVVMHAELSVTIDELPYEAPATDR